MNTLLKCLYGCVSFVFILFACAPKEKSAENELYVIDIGREAPVKEMVLQDMAEVEYIRMETSDEMLWQGWAVSAFTDQYIIDYHFRSGDVLVFDRKGKGIRKINRKGESGEEYSLYSNLLFDEEQEELYFNDPMKNKILVYTLDGTFKRALDHAADKRYTDLRLFDSERLIVYNSLYPDDQVNTYLILSRETGAIEEEFLIPQMGNKLNTQHRMTVGEQELLVFIPNYPLIATPPEFILTEISNDTIFTMNRAMELTPFIVQQPARRTMESETFLFYAFNSSNYLFLTSIEKIFKREHGNINPARKHWMYDKKEGKLYQPAIRNGDFTTEEEITITTQQTVFSAANQNVYLQVLHAGDLVEAYANNQLTGRLKEIAKELDEEDNPVILVARFR
ncbi:6-bladed beta-propeller [Parabacteroides sp. PF5-6]|uniref:6-bladed beta-propeller n=1 Tax=Parabacteroides sp. PF5-6 TaxID=1742403 RepID=UPI002405CF53|nr:6-bladed beta-propeller [Parabacteroides sp. PF5-6]MDF9828726.1 hypothetical protein [Parabacteroides sp. PF5-6]